MKETENSEVVTWRAMVRVARCMVARWEGEDERGRGSPHLHL